MRTVINSAANPKVKLAVSLHQRKYREAERLFLAEGLRLAEMAVSSGWEIEYGFYTMEAAKEFRAETLLTGLESKCTMYEIPAPLFRRISETQTPQGIMLVMRIPQVMMELSTLLRRKKPLVIALDNVQDPGNVGTIIRTADAAGVDGVVLLGNSADVFSSKTVRASMGSIFHIPIISNISQSKFLHTVEEWGIPLFAADIDMSAITYYQQDFREAAAIVFGNEANGITDGILARSQKIYIPMQGHAESLNVAVAAGIILYETVRQRL